MSSASNSQLTVSPVVGAQQAASLQTSLAWARVLVFLLARNSVG